VGAGPLPGRDLGLCSPAHATRGTAGRPSVSPSSGVRCPEPTLRTAAGPRSIPTSCRNSPQLPLRGVLRQCRKLAVLMLTWPRVTLACVVLGGSTHVCAAQLPPVPEHPIWAQTSLGQNAKVRCPDLRMTDEGTMAVVVFWLARSGIASQISIKSSSGSSALDSAAASCVTRLRFAPATTLGSGDAVDSWQQVGFRWVEGHAEGISSAAVPTAGASRNQDEPNGHARSVTVHVCVDESGKLKQDPTIVRSSGVASLDQAAIRIAASGSAYYRPDGAPVSGCAELAIRFDTR
jgi:TonB family protein